MATATLSRSGTSVTIDLFVEGNELAVARDVGKPTLVLRQVGREDPLPGDNLSAGDAFTFTGVLLGSSAYADAKKLAEDLIKPRSDGSDLSLDLSDLPSRGTYTVAPVTQSAVTLSYVPGRINIVGVQATLSVADRTVGGPQDAQSHDTPDSGSGVKLTDGSNPVTIDTDLEIVRQVGRPNDEIRPQTGDLPIYYANNDPASDVFEISGQLVDASATGDANTLEETLVRARQGTQNALELHFLNNLFNLDQYDVMPVSSQALRTTFNSGTTGTQQIPTLQLRVVDTT